MSDRALIDVESLALLLARAGTSPASVLLDCRFDLSAPDAGRQAYLQAHIPGARFADLNEVLAGPVSAASGRHPLPSAEALAARLATFGIGRDSQVIAYDGANGSFAARAWWLLRWLGIARVAVLDGGFAAWVARGGATEAGAPATPAPSTARFEPLVDTAAVVTAAQVLASLRRPEHLLVDARAAERYAGSVEPIDPVAGHVPGAVNHPFTRNVKPDGRFLAAAELRRLWQETLGGHAPADVILMCGSGVTACHDLLAMELAGLPGAKLYAGSWSEWIADPNRPVARHSANRP